MTDSAQTGSVGGIPPWVLSALAVAVLGAALWWGTREQAPVALAPPKTTQVTEQAPVAKRDSPGVDPEVGRSLLGRAIQLERDGDLASALVLTREAASFGAGEGAYLLEAKILILQKHHQQAQAPLYKILETNPTNAQAHYNLGLSWQQVPEPDYNKARNAYLAALKTRPEYAEARFNLVVLCLSHGVFDEATHHADEFAKQFPNDKRLVALNELVAKAKAAAASETKQPAGGN